MVSYEPISFNTAAVGPRVDWETGFRLDDVPIAYGLGTMLTPRLSDLLDIAMAAYVTDRLRPRRDGRSREGWSRRLPVRLAVRDLAFWRRAEVADVLLELLGWLTDDAWEFEFSANRAQARYAETQLPLFFDLPEPQTRFGLYSGGLDSFLGAARDAQAGGELVLVSATTSPAMRAVQTRTLSALRRAATGRLRGLQIPIGLRTDTIERLTGRREAPEPSQRTRGLVFLVLGAASALSAGARQLRVYENGVGAMNLPLTEAQYGAHNTRAMRPETMLKAGKLLTQVAECTFTIVNPSFPLTKAQLCAAVPETLREIITDTVSCDTGLTHRGRQRLCGTCTSCLLRRQALRASGLVDTDDAQADLYRCDVLQVADPSDARLRRLHYMLDQAAQFERALAAPDPGRALGAFFPDLRSIAAALRVQGHARCEALISTLLQRYVAEWHEFSHPLTARYLTGARTAVAAA